MWISRAQKYWSSLEKNVRTVGFIVDESGFDVSLLDKFGEAFNVSEEIAKVLELPDPYSVSEWIREVCYFNKKSHHLPLFIIMGCNNCCWTVNLSK